MATNSSNEPDQPRKRKRPSTAGARPTPDNRPANYAPTEALALMEQAAHVWHLLNDAQVKVEEYAAQLLRIAYGENHPMVNLTYAYGWPGQTGRVYGALKAKGVDTSNARARLQNPVKPKKVPAKLKELPDIDNLLAKIATLYAQQHQDPQPETRDATAA